MSGSMIEFAATGTRWQIEFAESLDSKQLNDVENLLKKRAEEFEAIYSRFRETSLISKMSKKEGVYNLPPDGRVLFDTYLRLAKETNGDFSPLVGNLLVQAGYDKELSFKKNSDLKSLPKIEEVFEYNFPQIKIIRPWQLDFGAAGKGYLIDILGELLTKNGYNDFCIDAGGDILYKSCKNTPLRVGLENPRNFNEVIGVVQVSSGSICGSSGSRRHWGEFHHIINPSTLNSPTEILSTWVMARDAILADGLATCLFFRSPEELQKSFEFEYLILMEDFTVRRSKNFTAELF